MADPPTERSTLVITRRTSKCQYKQFIFDRIPKQLIDYDININDEFLHVEKFSRYLCKSTFTIDVLLILTINFLLVVMFFGEIYNCYYITDIRNGIVDI